ncbi:hypothetical protein HJC23_000198 [Cyclotella cryptica]|uniref:Uncharacterized protein n=1 Tax=Cyclotella cryptica TaxID=29204 RepID=A0ABD3QEA5_9STRA
MPMGIHQPMEDTRSGESQVLGQECRILKAGSYPKTLEEPQQGWNELVPHLNEKDDKELDLGILVCKEDGRECVEDSSSSLGGRCLPTLVSSNQGNSISSQETLYDAPHRKLCSKCEGYYSCDGLSPDYIANNIGCGSCIGDYACRHRGGTGSIVMLLQRAQIRGASMELETINTPAYAAVSFIFSYSCTGRDNNSRYDVDYCPEVVTTSMTSSPTSTPTNIPTSAPTVTPTSLPKSTPTVAPTSSPSFTPTVAPTPSSTSAPTITPTSSPMSVPTITPTSSPKSAPTVAPTSSPNSAPTVAPTSSPSFTPTVTPTISSTSAPTITPTSSTTPAPTITPTSSPTSTHTVTPTSLPKSAPTVAPTSSPMSAPTVALTSSPSFTPTVTPTSSSTSAPTITPTSSPMSAPTVNHTSSPTSTLTVAPTSSPKSAPTVAPTSSPKSAPTVTPTSSPTSAPTVTPTSSPTSAPTVAPTFSPTSTPIANSNTAPTSLTTSPIPPATPDGPLKPTHQPTTDKVPKDTTMSNQSNFWYPDWEGDKVGCVQNGKEPSFMTHNPALYLFLTKDACCKEHYSWNFGKCMGDGTGTSGVKWYVNWLGQCLNDGKARDYMVNNPSIWLYDTQEECCNRFYSYAVPECMGTVASTTGSGKFFPDWDGLNLGCIIDVGSTRAPQYMQNNPTLWMFVSLGTSDSFGSEKWYMDWTVSKCVKDCKTGTDCGGLATLWDTLYHSQSECCKEKLWWNTEGCEA